MNNKTKQTKLMIKNSKMNNKIKKNIKKIPSLIFITHVECFIIYIKCFIINIKYLFRKFVEIRWNSTRIC